MKVRDTYPTDQRPARENLILHYLKKYKWSIFFGVSVKFAASVTELLIPYVMEHLVDDISPSKKLAAVLFWGMIMILLAVVTRFLNVTANRNAVKNAARCTYEIRRDLFDHVMLLSGSQVDEFGLTSLTSRMTSDSYNVQNFIRMLQAMGIRAPIMLIGGIVITLTMDSGLAMILCVMAPVMIVLVVTVSRKGIPLYEKVQRSVDDIVRIMRENITGIRVVKALSREKHERKRFGDASDIMTVRDRKAGIVMALPGPLMTMMLNIGLTMVVLLGARRVNEGLTQPGVILAFLTYFNLILNGVMGLNRLFMQMSKANASADRIGEIIYAPEKLKVLPAGETEQTDDFIVFDRVTFRYGGKRSEDQQAALEDISFTIRRGGSLGIIGATGSGKTTVINLLMRFYDPEEGRILINGRDIRTFEMKELRSMFGAVFQNDMIFADTIRNNTAFGRDMKEEELKLAAVCACADSFIGHYQDGYDHRADIHGANFSGGQRQRLLITRALASHPEILVLDDSSSALDYRTDAELRKGIREHYGDTTMIVIAQRVSSILSMDRIIFLEEGRIAGYGSHENLLRTCTAYREIYDYQMGEAR